MKEKKGKIWQRSNIGLEEGTPQPLKRLKIFRKRGYPLSPRRIRLQYG
jgi:hypothetical protein